MSFISQIGQTLGIHLEVIKPLETRKGSAYQIRSTNDQTMMLLKTIDLHDTDQENVTRLQSLRKEAAIMQKIPDFTQQTYIASGKLHNHFWILRKWLNGQTAWRHTEYIRKDQSKKNKIRFIHDLCNMFKKVMAFYQLGYLHGDLQPSHFIIDSSDHYHLIDLETAIDIDDSESIYRGALVHYVSPEVAKGMLAKQEHISLDVVSEIYSFGAVAFFLYTGVTPVAYGASMKDTSYHYPFHEKLAAVVDGRIRSFEQAEATAFPELERILMRCLEGGREKRYQTFKSLYTSLELIESQICGD